MDWSQVRRSISEARGVRHLGLARYHEDTLEPLSGLGRLRRLVLMDRPRVRSLAGLAGMPGLQALGTYLAKDLGDLTGLRGRTTIEELELEGCRKIAGLEDLAEWTALRTLNASECGDVA